MSIIALRHAARGTVGFFTNRSGLFVLLAFLLAAQYAYIATLAASLFLSHVGAKAIPLYYLLFAAVSIPCSTLLSAVIDRFPRHLIFKYMLGIFVIISLAMSALLDLGDRWYYVIYLGIAVCEQLLYSVYYVLFADYFSVTEAKRTTARVAIGITAGGLVGGTGISLVTSLAGPRDALLLAPLLVGILMGYFAWLARRHQPLESIEPAAQESLAESLRAVPRMLRHHRLVALLAVALFINVILQCVSEYLAFSIYTIHFPNVDELTTFLGFVNAGLSLLGFVIVIAFTEPQMRRLGVAVMNLAYPALIALSFGVLTVSTSLPAGILAHIAYDPFVQGIDVPVSTMNYNAIRYRLIGRVRVFIDGFVNPLGLALAGMLLEAFQRGLTPSGIAAIGLFSSLLLLVLHWQIGKHYVRGLFDMLRDGAVDFENVDRAMRLPAAAISEIRTMLGGDQQTAYAGLQMVLSCNHEFTAAEIAPALAAIPIAQARNIIERLATTATAARRKTFEQLAASGTPAIRQLALEALIKAGAPPIPDIRALLTDSDEGIRTVAAATVLVVDPADAAALAILAGPLEAQFALGAINVLRSRGNETVAAALASIGRHPDASVRAAALMAAASLTAGNDKILAWAQESSLDQAPAVREVALAILARTVSAHNLGAVLDVAWTDSAPGVRHAVVHALESRGEETLPAIYSQMWSPREEAQLAAIEALGRILGPSAENRLLRLLEKTAFPLVAFYRNSVQLFSPDRPGWQAMAFALEDSAQRALRLVMQALEALGHRRTLNLVRATLNVSDARARANAIESLASLPRRQFVGPITPLFEDRDTPQEHDHYDRDHALRMLRAAQSSNAEGLRAAAAVAWHFETGEVPAEALKDSSRLVVETIHGLMQRGSDHCPYPREVVMNRLAFLHSVPLFCKMTLEDLIVLDGLLTCETYLRGESIVTEGKFGDRLCIVYRGDVAVRKRMPDGERELARLKAGDFFGEMSLFDDEPRSATVSAIDDVEVLVLNRDRFQSLVQQRPSVLMELCTTLVRRLRATAS